MQLRYVGPFRHGIDQIGRTPVLVPYGVPFDTAAAGISDELAARLLAGHPEQWEAVDGAADAARSDGLAAHTKSELLDMAADREIEGRSSMTKEELIEALASDAEEADQ